MAVHKLMLANLAPFLYTDDEINGRENSIKHIKAGAPFYLCVSDHILICKGGRRFGQEQRVM